MGREIRISTTTKDPREGVARARVLRVALDQVFHSGALCSRDILTARLQTLMSNFRRPPIGSGTFNTDIRDGRYVATDIKPGEGKEAAETVALLNRDYLSQISTTPPAGFPSPVMAPEGTEIHHPAFLSKLSLLTVAEMVQLFMKDVARRVKSGNLGPKAYKSQEAKLEIFTQYFGKVAIGSLDAEQVQQYEIDLESYPQRRGVVNIQPAWSVRQVISAVKAKTVKGKDGKPLSCLSPLTVSGYMVVTRQMLKFAAKKFAVHPLVYEPKEGSSSAKKTRGQARTPFDDNDMRSIFENPFMAQAQYEHPYQYWVPMLAAFTGARISEICQLCVTDIIDIDGIKILDITDEYSLERGDDDGEDDANDEWQADAEGEENQPSSKRLKNLASRRQIPVHSKVLEMGFLNFVERRKLDGHQYLFDLKRDGRDGSGTRPSRWFNGEYLRRDLGIADKRKVFHCFRHAFITRVAQAIIEANERKDGSISALDYPEAAVLRRLVGHSDVHVFTGDLGRPDAHDGYQHGFKPAVMKRVMERFTLDVNFTPFVMPQKVKQPARKSTLTKVVKEPVTRVPKPTQPTESEPETNYGIGFEDVDMGKFLR